MGKITKILFSLFLLVTVFSLNSGLAFAVENIPSDAIANSNPVSEQIPGSNQAQTNSEKPTSQSDQCQVTSDNADWFFKKKPVQLGKTSGSDFWNAFKHFFQSIFYSVKCFFKKIIGGNSC